MIPVGRTTSERVKWVWEKADASGALSFAEATAEVAVRDWDVTDERERAKVESTLEHGNHVPPDWYDHHAQWFIDSDRNAAALVVYREPTKEAVTAWAEWMKTAAQAWWLRSQ